MFLILIIAGFITGSCTESSAGTYDYQGSNYNAYSHGKSDPTESTGSNGVIVSETGFSPSDSRYALSGSVSGHDSMTSGYLSSSYPVPTRSTQYSTPLQYSTSTYDKSYSSPYSSISATPAAYAAAKQYAPAGYSSSSNNHMDTLAYANASPSLSGFTGSSSGIGEYTSSHGGSVLGLRGYAPTSGNRGSSASDYTSGYLANGGVLSGSAHSSLGGHAASSHIGSNFAGYATSANTLGAHVDPAHSYTSSSAHVVPGNTISHDYSVNEGDVNYGSTNEAQRYATPTHSSDFAYKDAGYSTGSPSTYGAVKGAYLSGGHLSSYSPSTSPYYVRAVDSASHGNTAHYSVSPNLGYSSGYKAPFSLSSLYGGSPTKIIYVKDSSYGSSSFPFSFSSLKNKLYGSPSHISPVYVPAPSNLSGYLSRGYPAASSSYQSYP